MQQRFVCIEGHTEGMPVRMVVEGAPPMSGGSVFDWRTRLSAGDDWLRRALMMEPRGHAHMSGTLLYPPVSPQADFSLLFIETSGWLPMCGHATIGSITFAIESGLITPRTEGEVVVDVPAGTLKAYYRRQGNKVTSVRFVNIPSFIWRQDVTVEHPSLGELTFDIAFGGNFYPIVEPQKNFSGCEHYSPQQLLQWGVEMQRLLNESYDVTHPDNPTIAGVRHCMWSGAPLSAQSDARSVVIAGNSLVDRSPCGTGTSARVAQRYLRGLLDVGQPFVHESIIGSQFTGAVHGITRLENGQPAVFPSVEGRAWITGRAEYLVDDSQPYWSGFSLDEFVGTGDK
ncbi:MULTISPECIES: 4-hydroxyproline epimerase [Enterobacteriaceae]|uniref:4-hydroxyproline epimerase n=1 Tax=Enterobacteriaceae TaxID=543 RepID=UPI0006A5A5A3|nr:MULTISPECIES: 4-hydroxyproline epimerase [Enterobacteriaceae]EKS6729917.1 4-hydroxyproline epimerase [Enterobacter mori]EES0030179.1 4-hydroxyproline epimerase [Escherichia coli]MBX8911097.1 4-hydroxyproline epimerase [Enterobacter ludwigii]MCD9354861.1 4-hydroxyproline epimerase [Klebsiella pneumoniae]MCD9375883.1 4-hydroxyproline epimerase [Klebsiella pneumoniae]